MAENIFSGDIDPEIAALINGPVTEVKGKAKIPFFAQKAQSSGPAVPEFTSLFDDADLSGDVKDKSNPVALDLSVKTFKPITKFEENPPLTFLQDPNYYKACLGGEGDEAQTLHGLLTKYMQAHDIKDKAVFRQQIIPAYWNFLRKLILKISANGVAMSKLMSVRFGIVIPSLLTPEQKDIFQRIVYKNETGESIFYTDEWLNMVANGQVGASVTDESKSPKGDEKARLQAIVLKTQGKKEACEALLKAKSEERRALESLLKDKLDAITSHDNVPGLVHIQSPYTDNQKKSMNEVMELMRRSLQADRDLSRAIEDFNQATSEHTQAQERIAGLGSGFHKADLQAVAQEYDTIRQMAKMCIGRKGNHFPILSREYLHGNMRDIGTRENVIQLLTWIESIDSEAYCRQFKTQMNRIVPYVILSPNYGDLGICWEPFDRFNRATSRGRVCIPMYTKNLQMAVINAVADLRWQVAKEKASYYWMEEGLTGNYYQWYQAKKLKGDLKELFIADYIIWILKESEGIQKLDKEVRQIFWRYLPFTKEIKDKLKVRSLVYQELYQKDLNRQMSDGY